MIAQKFNLCIEMLKICDEINELLILDNFNNDLNNRNFTHIILKKINNYNTLISQMLEYYIIHNKINKRNTKIIFQLENELINFQDTLDIVYMYNNSNLKVLKRKFEKIVNLIFLIEKQV